MIVCASGFQVILRPGSIPFCGIFINYRHDIFMYISFSTEVVLIEALPSEREAIYFTLRFFFISLLRVQGSLCIAITNKVRGGGGGGLPTTYSRTSELRNPRKTRVFVSLKFPYL